MRDQQLALFAIDVDDSRSRRSGSFVDNVRLPIHRWFRYSAGFSAEWVRELLLERAGNGPLNVLDPFAGSGTVMLEAERQKCAAIGLEAHPFVARVAATKLHWRASPAALRQQGQSILAEAKKVTGSTGRYPPLIVKCFPEVTLQALDKLNAAWRTSSDGTPVSELCWLALAGILRACSPVGTAQWQYVLPRKSKAKVRDPFAAFESQIELMAHDMKLRQRLPVGPAARLLVDDARGCGKVPNDWCDLVVTSPPYANNYDYADATRLEMCFFGEIRGWGDLQTAVRQRLVRACTQHVARYADEAPALLESELLAPIDAEIRSVCTRLAAERENHGGKKPYHTMIACYFLDMAAVWQALRRIARQGATVCFVIGDSAPYGVHVPVERWLGDLAVAAGFKSYRFEKLRDRNTKWKNRKHRVPLHEGRLWVEA